MLAQIIPSHKVAAWLLTHIDGFLGSIGLESDHTTEEVIYVGVIVGVALALGWVIRKIILFVSRKWVALHDSEISRSLIDQRVLTHCSHVIPPLVILGLIPFAFEETSRLLHIIEVVLQVYTVIVIAIAINAVLTFIWTRYDQQENTKNLPLNGILNVAKGVVWIIVAIVSVSVILDKSPAVLLTGLGAFAAALMLIFKDSILGFVAGIQLSQNDMLRVGDWIVVPSTIANGIVVDVSLTAVKVQNWDNTIVTLPPYTLVSTSFQNWRGMSDSGYRLISRSVIFDNDSIKPCDETLLGSITAKYPEIANYVNKLKSSGKNDYDPGLATVNGTIETNLGLFRAYMCQYLLNHPLIGTDQQILVRIMVPTGEGMPLQIYCYTTTAWTAYEAVQSQIFEHVAVACGDFGLKLYNSPSGQNIESLRIAAPGPKES